MNVSLDSRGRQRINLGKSHPYANSAGWQYTYRYRMMCYLNRKLSPNEHVHHLDGNISNNSLTNLIVVDHKEHGKIHSIIKPQYDYELNEWLNEWSNARQPI